MCRIFGCVARAPVAVRHELVEASNPLMKQSEHHDSGWGIAAYPRAEGEAPVLARFPEPAWADAEFERATRLRGRIFNVHVRRATVGGLTIVNTHPFVCGNYSFSHNGTISDHARLLEHGVQPPVGETDSELFFNYLLRDLEPADVAGSLRRSVREVVRRSPFSGLNFLLSDGERLYAYRLGLFELHWRAAADRLLVSSEVLTDDPWHSVQQDVLLTLDPADLEEPHAERLIGDPMLARAEFRPVDEGEHLRGAARGAFAAARARQAALGT